MTADDLEKLIRLTPDFPKPGILFRDITPLLRDALQPTIDCIADLYSAAEWAGIDAVVGIESRGFILAAALAYAKGKRLLVVRKPGKLPPPVNTVAYSLEYGQDTLQMAADIPPQRVLIADDVIATGGTLGATCELCERGGHAIAWIVTLINLAALNDFRRGDIVPRSLFRYGD